MPQIIIENPILNSPYTEPARHFRFTEEGITDEIVEQRRVSSYFVPIPQRRKDKAAKVATARNFWVRRSTITADLDAGRIWKSPIRGMPGIRSAPLCKGKTSMTLHRCFVKGRRIRRLRRKTQIRNQLNTSPKVCATCG